MKDLSIVIVNYNNSKLLKECLSSVYASTHNATLEIFVSDNGSVDDSVAMMRANFPEVVVIENRENLGFIRASNIGLKRCTGRYKMLLNDDTVTRGGAFDTMMEFMDRTSEAGACGPLLLNVDGTPQRQGGIWALPFWKSEKPREVSFLTGACLMLKKEVIDKIGLMDENLFFYNDDLDWCKRVKNAGWKIFFLPEAKVVHYGGYSTRRKFNRRMFTEGFRGGLYFCKKHYGGAAFNAYRASLIIFFPVAVLGLASVAPFQGMKTFSEKLGAYYDIFKIAMFGPIEYPWGKK